MLCDSFVFLVMREVCGEEVYAGGELFYIKIAVGPLSLSSSSHEND